MGDLNLLNAFFDQENFLFSFDKDDFASKRIDKQDEEPNDWFSEDTLNDTLNQVLPLFDSLINGNEILQNATANECSSDSGLSSEQSFSPTRTTDVDDFQSPDCEFLEDAKSVISTAQSVTDLKDETLSETESTTVYVDETSFDAVEFVKEEVVEYEEIPISSVSDSNSSSDVYILRDDGQDDEFVGSPIVISYPESRTVKLVNNRGKRLKNGTSATVRNIQLKRKSSDDYTSDRDGSDDSDFLYPRLQLTPEEQKLAAKEGIKLPTHYPLSKAEERELKRIRRKIRNKISAQDSRRRKKEHLDNLEEQVKRTSEENAHLMKRIKTLESQRLTLAAQIRKLQASLARCSGQTAQPSTCLLVLIMSLALVLAPTLKNSTMMGENEDEGISLPEEPTKSSLDSVRTPSRNLLFSHKAHEGQCNIEEETKAISEQLQRMQIPDSNVLSGLLEMLKLKIGKESSLLKDHDYFRPRKRQNSGNVPAGDSWLPSKMAKISELETNTIILENIVNKTGRTQVQEPVVIDLLSD
ncbi:hypothetical protein V9T40_011234 [Parthenolecanium corni]|uniref:BZIP domain-containing protein n=1 Tax=Parthenolecanium corni TaxID=536013 RepID=A0AAN9T539_9HEMI